MKTNIEKTFHVDEPIAKVWENLSDPARIVTCVPGASLTEQMDEDNFKGEVTLKFGPVKASYNGQITFQERNAETRHMQLLGKGLDSKGKGSADMLMNGKLVEKDGGTEVTCSMEVTITGM
ncbi:MAG: SRPBCC family protein, partial [Phaeodactylibacter sp.]|nr:SRPBCC family protein [Phaeodactylibacter sp.]